MIDPLLLLAFFPAALALNLTPGADMLFCLGQGLRAGVRAAWAASAGIAAGAMVQVAVAGLGLGAVIAAHLWAFDAIRWAGVAYLLWLAVATVRGARRAQGHAPPPPRRAFLAGLTVNLTNPKVILFVLAFIPQFIDPARPVLAQFLIYGAVLALGGLVVNGLIGTFAVGAGRRLAGSGLARRWLGWIGGGIFAALALRLAWLERA